MLYPRDCMKRVDPAGRVEGTTCAASGFGKPRSAVEVVCARDDSIERFC